MKLRISTVEVNNPFWVEIRVSDADRFLPFEQFVDRIGVPALKCIYDKFSYVDEVEMFKQKARDLGLIPPDKA